MIVIHKDSYNSGTGDDDDHFDENYFIHSTISDLNLPASLDIFTTKRPKLKPLLAAPVAVCTIDYLIAAGEPHKHSIHGTALMRLMHSDLILDEIDSFDPKALVAVCRLIQCAAMCGRHVIVSSATISSGVMQQVNRSYAHGIRMRDALRALDGLPGEKYRVALIDNKLVPTIQPGAVPLGGYWPRLNKLMHVKTAVTKPVELLKLAPAENTWQEAIVNTIGTMHAKHSVNVDGINVSAGVVRVANIKPAIKLARAISDQMNNARVCCYHSNHTVIQRHFIEKTLGALLNRKHSDKVWKDKLRRQQAFKDAVKAGQSDLQLVVVGTPVLEVGRDFDFDYGIIDISSSSSIVQTAGRVNRHRLITPAEPNVAILQYSNRYCTRADDKSPVFCMPGVESPMKLYNNYDAETLYDWTQIQQIDTRMRFDYKFHKLPMLDDTSIKRQTQRGVRRITGETWDPTTLKTTNVDDNKWQSRVTYTAWPLRDDDKRETWKALPGLYERREFVGKQHPDADAFGYKYVDRTGSVITADRHDRDWLVLDAQEQVITANRAYVAREGTNLELYEVDLQKRKVFHDESFGFWVA